MKLQNLIEQIQSNHKAKYLIILILCGILLMLYPSSSNRETRQSHTLEREEARLADILCEIEGVGACKVLLSVQHEAESATFKGAVIVCGGTEHASVRYDILSSVMAYTGLEVDRITICPIKNS